MTLLEMIKKYENAKEVLEKQRPELSILASMGDIDQILEDLHSIENQQPSWVTIRDKIMKKIDRALEENDPDGAHTLAQLLEILPD